MKNRALSLLLSLSLCLPTLPLPAAAAEPEVDGGTAHAVSALSAGEHSDHCLCGETHRVIGGDDQYAHKDEEKTTFQPWSSTTSLPENTEENKNKAYYLTTNVTITSTWTPADGTVLCLNGHDITMNADGRVIFLDYRKLTVTDCKPQGQQGTITHGTNPDTGKPYIGGCVTSASSNSGNACLWLYGGRISNNVATTAQDDHGGGVYLANTASLTMYGGEISGNTATGGGGVYSGGGSISIYAGQVTGNTATGSGGGLYTGNGYHSTTLDGGTITGNTAATGGGIYAGDNLVLKDVSVKGNTATTSGGGVYIPKDRTLTFSGGAVISGNTKSGGEKSNVYLEDTGSKTVISVNAAESGALKKGAIGVTSAATPPLVIGGLQNEEDTAFFFSDDERYMIGSTPAADDQSYSHHLQLLVDPHTHCACGSAAHTTIGSHTADDSTSFSPWTSATALPDTTGRWFLTKDVALTATYTAPGGLILCLNGHTVTANGDFDAITLESDRTATLTDCKGSGTLARSGGTGRGASVSGTLHLFAATFTGHTGGVAVQNGGTFHQYSGSISNNTATGNGGGVLVQSGGTFHLQGGKVSGNSAANGGGVYAEGTFQTGGYFELTGNTATDGGGAYIADGATASLSGSGGTDEYPKITGNTATTSGGGIYAGGTVSLSGKLHIGESTVGGGANNVYLPTGKSLTVGSAGMDFGASVGVTTQTAPTADAPVVIAQAETENWQSANSSVFSSDEAYNVVVNGKEVSLQAHRHVWEYSATDDTITARCVGTVGTCPLSGNSGGSLKIVPPAGGAYDGTAKEATLTKTDWMAETPTITYHSHDGTSLAAAPVNAGTYTASITLGGVTARTATFTITAREVKLTGGISAQNRRYVSGDTTVSLVKGTLTFEGLADGEALDISLPATGTMADPDVGTGKAVTYTGLTLQDTETGKAGNYALSSPLPTVTVDISKAAAPTLAPISVQVHHADGKAGSGEADIGGVMPTDAGTPAYAKGTGATTGAVALTGWDVDGTGKVTFRFTGGQTDDTIALPVTVSSRNYEDAAVTVTITLTGKRNQAPLTLTDGTDPLTGEDALIYGETLPLGTAGGSGGGAVTYTLSDPTVAALDGTVLRPLKTGSVTVTAHKAGDGDYNDASSAPVSLTIAPRPLSFAATVRTKPYDGTTAAQAVVTFENVVPGETLTAGTDYTVAAAFADAEVGTDKAVTVTVALLSTAAAGNYTLPEGTISATGTITAQPQPPEEEPEVEDDDDGDDAPSFVFPFGDVTPRDSYYAAVRWAAENGITLGVTRTRFAPLSTANQGQLITFLWRRAGSPAPRRKESPFGEIPREAYCYDALLWATEVGIVGGDGDGDFRPWDPCTNAQALTVMYRAALLEKGEVGTTDVLDEDLYAQAAAWAVENGLASVVEDSRFAPTEACTRAQLISLFYRAYR